MNRLTHQVLMRNNVSQFFNNPVICHPCANTRWLSEQNWYLLHIARPNCNSRKDSEDKINVCVASVPHKYNFMSWRTDKEQSVRVW